VTRVKICGITRPQDAALAAEAGADAVGFVLAPSRRRVEVAQARMAAAQLPPFVSRVGVFVNAADDEIAAAIEKVPLDVIQLHGEESPETVRRWRERGVRVIKAIGVSGPSDLEALAAYDADAVLLDAVAGGRSGGTGRSFDWDLARRARGSGLPIILAGGLHPGNVVEALERVNPYAVDVSSGVEESAGRKSPEKVREFLAKVRGWDVERFGAFR